MRTLILSLALACAGLLTYSCTQAEVVADVVIKQINEKIGKHRVQLKEAEKLLVKLKAAKKKAKISGHMSKRGLDGYKKNVSDAQAKVDEMQGQLDKIKGIEDKGAPYMTSKGKELTKAKLNTLKMKVSSRLNVAKAKLKSAKQALRVTAKTSKTSGTLVDRLDVKIVDLQGKIEIIRNNIGLLEDMEEQRKLSKTYDSSAASGLLKEMDRTIGELDVTIDIDLETMFEESGESDANNGLSDDDVNLIDEL